MDLVQDGLMEPVCRPVSCGHVRDLGEAGFMYSDLRLRSQWFSSVSALRRVDVPPAVLPLTLKRQLARLPLRSDGPSKMVKLSDIYVFGQDVCS